MKKIFIGMTALTLCLCLTACGPQKDDSTITNLGNCLDETSNTISNIYSISPTELDLTTINDENLISSSKDTQQSLLNEQYYRAEILEKTAKIKDEIASKDKLTGVQYSALNDLADSLDKYTHSIKSTQIEMKGSAKAISSLKKNVKNKERVGAKLNRLACNSNLRSAYYENILNTLSEIENCLDVDENQTYQAKDVEEDVEEETEIVEQKNPKRKPFRKNIDTYKSVKDQNKDEEKNVHNRYDRYNKRYNSDTYGPSKRNIDTYRSPYGYGNYGTMPYGNAPYAPYGMPYGPYQNGGLNRYPNGVYGSNYYNRATSIDQAVPVSSDEQAKKTEPEKQVETVETVEKQSEEKTNQIANAEEETKAVSASAKRKHHLEEKDDDPIAYAY